MRFSAFGPKQTTVVLARGNGNIGGALSPIVFGVLFQFGSWQAPFIVAASLLVIGAAIWGFWLDSSTSVVEKKTI
jgi:MFS family permease